MGDDAFVTQLTKKKYLVLSSDTLVEDVHFRTRWTKFEQLGWKAVAVVLSDFAAMGAVIPRYLLINLGLPPNLPFSEVQNFYRGIEKAAQCWDIIVAGGDTVRAEKIFIAVSLIGETKKDNFISRDGAKPGNIILSTGSLGEAAAGLVLLEQGVKSKEQRVNNLISKHLFPQPRLKEGKFLAEKKLATSMIDCSDGLEQSVRLLTEANHLEAEIYLEKLPFTPGIRHYLKTTIFKKIFSEKITRRLLEKFWQLAVFGGEDYELIFTAEERNYPKIIRHIPSAFILGKIKKKKDTPEVKFYYFGKPVRLGGKYLQGKSYDAFLSRLPPEGSVRRVNFPQ